MTAPGDTAQPPSKSVRVAVVRSVKHGGVSHQPGQTMEMGDTPVVRSLERHGVVRRMEAEPAPRRAPGRPPADRSDSGASGAADGD